MCNFPINSPPLPEDLYTRKINIEPEKDDLEDDFPCQLGDFRFHVAKIKITKDPNEKSQTNLLKTNTAAPKSLGTKWSP